MEFLKGANGFYFVVAILAVAIVLELITPWRRNVQIDFARWLRNASMAFYAIMIFSLIPAIAGYGAAIAAETRGIGLFNLGAPPMMVQLIATVLVIDLLAYGEHRATHKWYLFWRLHRSHHSDVHVDASTSLRFHPLETIARAAVELGVIFLLGLPPEGIVLTFAVHAFSNTISHTNIGLPPAVDRFAARIIVTPHIHRLHHSMKLDHQYTNFGTSFTIWDQLFGTYCAPENLRDDEKFGLEGQEQIPYDSFANLALDPFRTPKDAAIPTPHA